MKILHVTPAVLDQAWKYAVPWLEKANFRGNSRYPLDDCMRDIEAGKKQLFRLVDGKNFAWLVIGCVENSENRTCIVYALGGDGALDMLPEIVGACEDYARHNGCQYITCSGRAGWIRELAKYGWNELNRTCGKEL